MSISCCLGSAKPCVGKRRREFLAIQAWLMVKRAVTVRVPARGFRFVPR